MPTDADGALVLEESDKLRYLEARDGDHLVTPFQCETCHIRNMLGRDPQLNLASDVRLVKLIRWASLDAFWASEPKTVAGTLREARRGLRIASALGFRDKVFTPLGPFPLKDTFGMRAAVVMLEVSLNPGRNDDTVQYGTVRKFRSAFSNIYKASIEGQQGSVMMRDTSKMSISTCLTDGLFFEKFTKGCHKRMGDTVELDRALSVEILVEIMHLLEVEWGTTMSVVDRWKLSLEGCFYVISFVCALRGEEVPLTNLAGIREHLVERGRNKIPHVIIALLGRFKNEHGDSNYHLLPVVNVTHSGIEVRRWIERGVAMCETVGYKQGPLFRDPETGGKMKAAAFEKRFFRRLSLIQTQRPDLIGVGVDIEEQYGVSRSFRRGATSRAADMLLPPDVTNVNNRWRSVEMAGAKQTAMTMRDHYTDVRLTLNLLLQFSAAM
jgi:hypothetical protein